MKYKCENELNTLSFRDFTLDEIKLANNKLTIYTNGGIAKYDNSCNEMLEERYISECEIQLTNVEITKFILEGGKFYNADDVLLKEIPDTDILPDKYNETFQKMKEGTIFFLAGKSNDDKYQVEFAVDVENDTYWIYLDVEKAIVGFERFMNRVIN